MSTLCAVISTHTSRHLEPVLAGVAAQSRRPDRTVISCDVADAAIEEVARRAAERHGLDLLVVSRSHQGESRSSQVRNNGVRALGAGADHLVFLDGDCCPDPACFAAHESLLARGELVIGFRYDLTPGQTEAFDTEALSLGRPPVSVSGDQRRALHARDRRYRRAAWLRRFGLAKPHKPKLLSANFAVAASMFSLVNGFDEEYLGYGGEDDDLGRRIYAAGGRPVVGIREATVYHLWHPTRAARRWADAPGIARFKLNTPVRAVHGLDRPYPQPEPAVLSLESARGAGTPAGGVLR